MLKNFEDLGAKALGWPPRDGSPRPQVSPPILTIGLCLSLEITPLAFLFKINLFRHTDPNEPLRFLYVIIFPSGKSDRFSPVNGQPSEKENEIPDHD